MPWNSPPSGQTTTYRKTKGIQSYLRIWGTYDPIESSPSEPRKGRLCGCSANKSDFGANFGPKTCPCTPQELARHYDKHENIVFLVPSHDSSKKFGGCPQKMDFGPKNSTFGPKKAHFGQSGPKNGLPSGQTATYRKTKGIQSCLMIWGTYDPIESGPSDPKKWGLYGCSVKKCRFWPILRCWLWMSLAAKIWVRLSFAVARYYTWCLFWIFIAWNVTEL